MTLIAVIAVIFIVLLILPFVVALLSVRKSRKASLYVKSDNVRDPRYFSNSFRALVNKGIDRQNRTIKMSKLEPFVYADGIAGDTCNALVIAEALFRPTGVSYFCKEVLAESSAFVPSDTTLRAIACMGEMELGEECEIVRWADSERQMTVKDGCLLGMSATSAERLLIAPECTFRRLYAPEIIIGYSAMQTSHSPVNTTVFEERWIDPEGVEPDETVEKTIVTEYSLEVGSGAVVMGSIKSNQHIFIHRKARINGNVIADGAIILDEGARVLGNVFSQDCILVGPNVEIGVKPKIKSLIARKSITMTESARVYGYIGCEVDSVTIARDDYQNELGKKQWSSKTELIRAEIAEERADDPENFSAGYPDAGDSEDEESLFEEAFDVDIEKPPAAAAAEIDEADEVIKAVEEAEKEEDEDDLFG